MEKGDNELVRAREGQMEEERTLVHGSGTKSRGGNWEVSKQKGITNDVILLATNVTQEHAVLPACLPGVIPASLNEGWRRTLHR